MQVRVQKLIISLPLSAQHSTTGPFPPFDNDVKTNQFKGDEESEDPWENMRVVRSGVFVGSKRHFAVQDVEMLFFYPPTPQPEEPDFDDDGPPPPPPPTPMNTIETVGMMEVSTSRLLFLQCG